MSLFPTYGPHTVVYVLTLLDSGHPATVLIMTVVMGAGGVLCGGGCVRGHDAHGHRGPRARPRRPRQGALSASKVDGFVPGRQHVNLTIAATTHTDIAVRARDLGLRVKVPSPHLSLKGSSGLTALVRPGAFRLKS